MLILSRTRDTSQPAAAAAPAVEVQDGLIALAAINSSVSHPVSRDRHVLTEEAAYHVTGFSFSSRKKWAILTSIFIVQLSMNFNAAIYGNAGEGVMADYGVASMTFKIGQAIFLIAYAFGCELWAPWSEELGRKWVLQGSLFLVNLWQIPCALSTNMTTIMVFRALGGLSSAGGKF